MIIVMKPNVPDDAVQELLASVRTASQWTEGPASGVKLMPVHGGPKTTGSLAALVFLEADAEFPTHPHLGLERVLVIEGAYRDSGGQEYWRGDIHESAAGSQHSFRAIGGIPCICAALHAISPEDP